MKHVKLLALGLLSIVTLTAATTSTIAWFRYAGNITFGTDADNVSVTGGSVASYYESGTGASNDPYIISNRNHLYNLAWLQYIGYYNDAAVNTTGIQQKYFKIKNDIDLQGLTLPPIGTEKYPFLGHFDGNNKTISNFTISNDDPDNDSSDFGVAKPSRLYDGEPSEIIGFFGVVGALPDQSITYTSSIVSISNITLEDFTVKSETSNTLIGLAAGYVDGSLSGIKVGESTIDVDGAEPITSITNNLSDYSLVGYTASTSTVSDFTKKISEKLSKSESGGNQGGFGASVNFKDYLEWFYELHQNKAYNTSNKPSSIGYMSYTGMTDSNIDRFNSKTGSTGNYYLRYNLPVGSISDPEAAFTATYTSAPNTGAYYNYSFSFYSTSTSGNYTGFYREYRYDGTYEQAFTATTTTAGSRWNLTFASGVSRFGNSTNFDLHKTSSNSTTTYPVYTGTSGGTKTNRLLNLAFIYADAYVAHLTNDNYIPIKFASGNASVDTGNTGYIIGTGLASSTNNVGNASPRIASYSVSYLNSSITDGEITNVYTVDTSGNKQSITETKTNGVVTASSPSYERYVSSRAVMGDTFDSADVSNGIHFDVSGSYKYTGSVHYRGSIANDSSDTYIEQPMLLKSYNGTSKTTRMPKGAIDFELEDSGYINFFAGMYNITTSVTQLNFFSLHHVVRSSPTAYTLKEIEKIYKSTTWTANHPNYVYLYADGTYSSGTISGDAIFDVAASLWAPRSKDNSLYYFEIPVNQGEYAMGSVDASHTNDTAYQGAYLIYLDIGSNGHSTGDTTMDAYYVETTYASGNYPAGVDFNITGLTSVGGNTICIALTYSSSSITGSIAFVPGSQVAVDSQLSGAGCSYDAGGILDDSESTQTIADITSSGGGGDRRLKATIHTNTGDNWELEYQEVLDGSGTITSTAFTSVTRNNVDVTSAVNSSSLTVPTIFISNIVAIKEESVAVQLAYHGTDFSITAAAYSSTTVSLTIPANELGSTALTVTYPSGNYNSLNINGSPYTA